MPERGITGAERNEVTLAITTQQLFPLNSRKIKDFAVSASPAVAGMIPVALSAAVCYWAIPGT